MSWEKVCALLLPPAPLWTPVLTPPRSLVPSAPFPRRPVLSPSWARMCSLACGLWSRARPLPGACMTGTAPRPLPYAGQAGPGAP